MKIAHIEIGRFIIITRDYTRVPRAYRQSV